MNRNFIGFAGMLLLYILMPCAVHAQKENNYWAFGYGSGLDFNSSPPTSVTTAIRTFEGCASICDAWGNLLFYSNSMTIWDRTHNPMPNGGSLTGESSMTTTQGVAISMIPGVPHQYYVFTLMSIPSQSLYYSIVDMTLNGGKGDVVATAKNVLLSSNKHSEKMAVVSGCGYNWLVLHHSDSALFYAHKITAAGIEPPVVSVAGPPDLAIARFMYGEMKASADGRLLALASPFDSLWLYRFDKRTGKVTDGFIVDTIACYSTEFSPDGTKLYGSLRADMPTVEQGFFQYDLSLLPDTVAVRASRYKVSSEHSRSLLRGADRKLYGITGYPARLSRINDPDNAGAACNFDFAVITPPSVVATTYYSLGNNTELPLGPSKTFTSGMDTVLCTGTPIVYSGHQPGIDFIWNDGVYGSDRSFTAPGTYWLTSSEGCDIYVDTFRLIYHADTMVHSLDMVLCFDDTATLVSSLASGLPDVYRWSDGSSGPTHGAGLPGTLWVTARAGCDLYVDTFRLEQIRFDIPVKDTFICYGGSLELDATVPGADSYRWQDSSAQPVLSVADSGRYTVRVDMDGCMATKTIGVTTLLPDARLGPDRTACLGGQVLLQPDVPGGTFVWQDNSTGMTYDVREPGVYSVTVTSQGCQVTDSIRVDFVRCDQCMVIPNAFTPNEDGRNDVFLPLFYCPVATYSMQVFNRYGEAVFKTSNPAEAWTGSYQGAYLELGTYYYLVQVRFDHPDAKDELYKGDISLIR